MQDSTQTHYKAMTDTHDIETGSFRWTITVPEDAIDENGHVNNVTYIQWMQDVAVKHSQATGGTDAMHKTQATWVVRTHKIEFFRPAFAGDQIQIVTWIANLRRVRSLRKYRFLRCKDDALLAEGQTDWVFIDTKTTRPRSIPAEVRNAFTILPDGP